MDHRVRVAAGCGAARRPVETARERLAFARLEQGRVRRARKRRRLNGKPVPVRSHSPLSDPSICASVCSMARAWTCPSTADGTPRRFGTPSGSGDLAWRITSSRSSIRSMATSRRIRLRSCASVRGPCQTRRRSVTRPASRSFISEVTGGGCVLAAPACVSSAAAHSLPTGGM